MFSTSTVAFKKIKQNKVLIIKLCDSQSFYLLDIISIFNFLPTIKTLATK